MTLDFPHPFGPTTPTRRAGKRIPVESTNDLNPDTCNFLSRIQFIINLFFKQRVSDDCYTNLLKFIDIHGKPIILHGLERVKESDNYFLLPGDCLAGDGPEVMDLKFKCRADRMS
ncbi:hypothetical protein [Candidatus Spongiihabitans sp.]|uniref:hypothetical protein n=1 Tax=Candidatus Spongiihabitans sp. TaxID=3101308 RepID=UPI003C7CDEB1